MQLNPHYSLFSALYSFHPGIDPGCFGQTIPRKPIKRAFAPIRHSEQAPQQPGASPFSIQYGHYVVSAACQQSMNIVPKLTAALERENVNFELLQGARHADLAFESPKNIKKVLDFLDRH